MHKNRSFARRLSALITAGMMSLAVFSGFTVSAGYEDEIAALQEKQAALAAERKKIEKNLKEYKENAEDQEEYLRIYDEKMKLQEQEIQNVNEQISILEADIADYEVKIAEKQVEVDEGIKDFENRLRVMYMTGNSSIASMLVGSADFYDILARMELAERLSRHDNDMIDALNANISELNSEKASLEEAKAVTEQKKADAEQILEELRETYRNHQETKAWYEKQAEYDRQRTDEIEQQEAQYEEELQEFIRKQQEELERKREEERKRREEEERKRKEEEERKKQEALEQGIEYVPEEPEEDKYTYATGGADGFIWPCPTVRNTTDMYGNRYIVEEGRNDFHKGIDITKPGCKGEPIVASAGGTVITASNTGNGYGIHVVIDHGDKISTLYAHMSKAAVSVGDEVQQGETIGYIGCTGYAYGNHCHFEVRKNGQHTDPMNYVSM